MEDCGVWMMAWMMVHVVVVCERCEDDNDGSGVCMAVGCWGTHMALVPCDCRRA